MSTATTVFFMMMKPDVFKKRTACALVLALLTLSLNSFVCVAEEGTEAAGNELLSVSEEGTETAETGLFSVSGEEAPEKLVTETELIISDTVRVRSLSSDFTVPPAFLTKKKLVFYTADRPVSDDTYLVLDVDGDYEISGLEDAGSLKFIKEKVSYNGLPAYHITVSADSSLYKQIVKRDIVLTDRNSGRRSKALKLTVQLGKKGPAAVWKKSLVTLNASDKGDFAVNSPKYEGFSIAPLSSNRYRPKIPPEISLALINENTVRVKAGANIRLNKTYPVQLWLINTECNPVKAVKKRFSVKLVSKESILSLKRAPDSSMDLSSRSDTAFHYRPVVRNAGLVLNDIGFSNASMSDNYILEKYTDPGTGEITDIFVRAKEEAGLTSGATEFSFNSVLGNPGMDAKSVKRTSYFTASRKTSRIRCSFVSGNKLMINETLSDNHIAGTFEIRVNSPRFGRIDPSSVKAADEGPFKSYWTVDRDGRVARVRVVINRSGIIPKKTYNLCYFLKAVGAPSGTKQTKITVKYKAE